MKKSIRDGAYSTPFPMSKWMPSALIDKIFLGSVIGAALWKRLGNQYSQLHAVKTKRAGR
jgi:hypothetical protein